MERPLDFSKNLALALLQWKERADLGHKPLADYILDLFIKHNLSNICKAAGKENDDDQNDMGCG